MRAGSSTPVSGRVVGPMLWSFLAGVAVGALSVFVLGVIPMIAEAPADEYALDHGIEGAEREYQ